MERGNPLRKVEVTLAEVAKGLAGRGESAAEESMGEPFDQRIARCASDITEEPYLALENIVANVCDYDVVLTEHEAHRLVWCARGMRMPESVIRQITGLTIPAAPTLANVFTRLAVQPRDVLHDEIVGIARDFDSSVLPTNGLRNKIEGGTSGWYLYSGEVFPEAADAFEPMHALHLMERCPDVRPYMSLPPGWRFIIAPGYEDVWFDETLLH